MQAAGANRAASTAGVVALATLLVLGAGFWLYFRLAPTPPRALKPGEGAPPAAGAPAAPGGAPGAPAQPIALPEDIKQYIAKIASDAEAKPKDLESWLTYGRVAYRASRIDPSYSAQAKKAFDHVHELDPKNLEGLRGLGNMAYDDKDRKTATDYYRKYLEIEPNDAEVRTDLGTMLYELGDQQGAITEYEKVIEKTPAFYQAYFNLGIVYDAQGDKERAHAQIEKARDAATEPGIKHRIEALLEAAKRSGGTLAEAAAEAARAAAASDARGGGAPAGQMAGGAPGAPGAAPAAGAGPAGGAPNGGAAAAAASAAAAQASTFPAAVEALLRGHSIAGPKVQRVEWSGDEKARVLMAGFPMSQMPEPMKNGYLDKLQRGVGEAAARFDVSGPVTIEIVDEPSGEVMATVVTKPSE